MIFTISSLPVIYQVYGAQLSFSDSTAEYYLIIQIITVTSDWQDIVWSQGLDVHTVRYSVTEGEEAVNFIDITGLNVDINQDLDTEMITVEIEAIVVNNSDIAIVEVNKGSLEHVDIELQVYEGTLEEFVPVTTSRTRDNIEVHQFNLAPSSSGIASGYCLTLTSIDGSMYLLRNKWTFI